MKPFIKLSLVTLFGLSLFFSNASLTQAETTIDAQQLFQNANTLFIKGASTSNSDLIRQAKDELSQWIKANNDSSDTMTLTKFLRLRGNTSIALGELNEAIADYKRANQYDPVAEMQLGICFLEKQQGIEPTGLKACYDKAVQIFASNRTAKTNPNYLIARILSGDKQAIAEYKHIIQIEPNSDQQEIYRMAAQEYLDQSDCQQILTNCKKD